MPVAEIAEFRHRDGRFAAGRSGNPAGRPKGSRNRSTVLAETLVEEHAEPLTAKMIELAKAGDAGLLRLFFKAIIAPARGSCVELHVAPGKELDFEEAFRVTARALFDGEITPDQALRIGRFISLSVRMRELKSRESYREAKLRLEAEKQAAPPLKRQYFSREKAPAALARQKVKAAPSPLNPASSRLPTAARHDVGPPVSTQYLSSPERTRPVSGQYFSQLRASTALAGSMAGPGGLRAGAAMG